MKFNKIIFLRYASPLLALAALILGLWLMWFGYQASDLARPSIEDLERDGVIPVLERGTGLAGFDYDSNGVRDDIDNYIDLRAKNEVWGAGKKSAVIQLIKELQQSLFVDLKNKKAMGESGVRSARAIVCLRAELGAKPISVQELEELVFNTRERIRAYIAYNRAASGSVITLPPKESACDH